jgi:hypothetical protein
VSKRYGARLPPFTSLFRHTTNSPAWAALSVGARAAFFEMQSNYNTNRQNTVFLSARTGSKKLNASAKTVLKWLRELESYGFIVAVQRAHLGVHGAGKATLYRLTDRYHAGKPPSYDFQNWDGVIFKPAKRAMTESDIRRIRKQNPVSRTTTPRVPAGHIRAESGKTESANNRSHAGYIRAEPECSHAGHIDSLASSSESETVREARVAPIRRRPWSTPVLTEVSGDEKDELLKILARAPAFTAKPNRRLAAMQ